MTLAGPGADVVDVGGRAADQQADLGDQQRIEQQGEEQRGGDEADDHQIGGRAAGHAQPGQPGGGRVEEVGDAGGGDEGQQDGAEEVEGEAEGEQEADEQGQALGAGGVRGGRGEAEFDGGGLLEFDDRAAHAAAPRAALVAARGRLWLCPAGRVIDAF